MKTIINHPDWIEVEDLMRQKMAELSDDIDYSKSMTQIGMQARANNQARKVLREFLKEIGFHRGVDENVKKRDFE